jgi:hypothetical protein
MMGELGWLIAAPCAGVNVLELEGLDAADAPAAAWLGKVFGSGPLQAVAAMWARAKPIQYGDHELRMGSFTTPLRSLRGR